MRYAVVGASQGVGKLIVERLAAAGHDVRAISRNPPRSSPHVEPCKADVTDPRSISNALNASFDAVFFTVDITGGIGGHALFGSKTAIREVTYQGCVNAIEAARKAPTSPRFILLSVLGHDRGGAIWWMLNTVKPGTRQNIIDRERVLIASGLPYVVTRAPKLTDGDPDIVGTAATPARHKLVGGMSIARADLAMAMIRAADHAPANSIWDVYADADGPVAPWLQA